MFVWILRLAGEGVCVQVYRYSSQAVYNVCLDFETGWVEICTQCTGTVLRQAVMYVWIVRLAGEAVCVQVYRYSSQTVYNVCLDCEAGWGVGLCTGVQVQFSDSL